MIDTITVCVWPDESWCTKDELDKALEYLSDDYQEFEIPMVIYRELFL